MTMPMERHVLGKVDYQETFESMKKRKREREEREEEKKKKGKRGKEVIVGGKNEGKNRMQ